MHIRRCDAHPDEAIRIRRTNDAPPQFRTYVSPTNRGKSLYSS
jgi:hypothetical protein